MRSYDSLKESAVVYPSLVHPQSCPHPRSRPASARAASAWRAHVTAWHNGLVRRPAPRSPASPRQSHQVYVKRVFWEALEEYTTQLLFLNFGIGTVMSTQVCALIFSILIMYILHWHFQVETSCLIKHLSLIVAQYILVSSNHVNIEKLQKRHTDWGASQRHLSLHSTLHQINLTQKYPSM